MRAVDAVELVNLFEEHGIEVYVDGGWAVDALMRRQTRDHSDLDIALPHKQVPLLREILTARGFGPMPRPDTRDCNFVLVDADGREVDVHSYALDENGNNTYGVEYRAEHLTGKGVINDRSIRCIAPGWLVKFHSGYEFDENDHRDVRLLCEKFGIPIPDEHK